MSKIISAPKDEFYLGKKISLTSIDLEKECPELFEYFQLCEQRVEEEGFGPYWYKYGYGPAPELGGVWTGGEILRPIPSHSGLVPPNAIITNIKYYWNNRNLRDWDRQVEVRIIVYSGGYAGIADITAHNKGILIEGNSLLAKKAQIQFQMKVGSLKARLYNPPYISGADVYVYY